MVVRGSAAIYGCEGAGAARSSPRTWRGRRRCGPASSATSPSSRSTSRTSPAAIPSCTCCMLRFQPEIGAGPRQPAGPLPDPAGGPGAARLRPAAAAAARRRRDRGDRGGGREPGPRRRSTSRPTASISLSRALRLLRPPGRRRSRRRSSGRRCGAFDGRLGAGGLVGDGVRLLRFGRGVDNRRLREEIGYEPRYDAVGAVRDLAGADAAPADRPQPASGRSLADRLDAGRAAMSEAQPRRPADAPEAIADFLRGVRGGVESGLDPLAAAQQAAGSLPARLRDGGRASIVAAAAGRVPRGRVGLRRGASPRRSSRCSSSSTTSGGGSRPRGCATCPPTAARCSSPTTPARCSPSTRR